MCEVLSANEKALPVHTLAQLDQNDKKPSLEPELARSHPVQENLQKRARAKYLTGAITKQLYANGYAGSDSSRQGGRGLIWSYFRTWNCSATIIQESDGQLKAHYCGYRWCMVCSRIRMAKAIARYLPVLEAWVEDSFLVTLTVLNCRDFELRDTIKLMMQQFTSCKRSMKRTHRLSFQYVRKLEVTYNKEADTYHPHFHVMVRGEVEAEALRSLWLKRSTLVTHPVAQDVRPMDKKGIKEVFKYFCKVLTKDKKTGVTSIDGGSLNLIMEAVQGMRTFQTGGFKLSDYSPVAEVVNEEGLLDTKAVTDAYKRTGETVVWIWNQEYADWVDDQTGECLTDYTPSDGMRELVMSSTPPGVDPFSAPADPNQRKVEEPEPDPLL